MTEIQEKAWSGFVPGEWQNSVNTRDFIQKNYTPYVGDEKFLAGISPKTKAVWSALQPLLEREREKGVLAADEKVVSGIISHGAGYIDKENEVIVGLQTDAPLKRALMPYGGLRMAKQALEAYGFSLDPETERIFLENRKTHNEAVFDMYNSDIRKARSAHIITGLPDAYGRGRIIGDYRRVALYGLDFLISQRKKEHAAYGEDELSEEVLRAREEMAEQIKALNELKILGARYGFDLGRPAENSREAVQWLYLAYLAATKEQNGAAMSIGRISTFLDIYFERDLAAGTVTESELQEIIDQFVMKLRIIRFIRTPDYNQIFAGDPTWVTESIGGIGEDGRPLVTKNSFRMLQTLYNLGPAPEPNLTILWSTSLPKAWKKFAAKVSVETSSIQYESDDLMRPHWGDDYGIACCVSAMRIGKQMQFFGARANLAKCLLYALNGGRDEISGKQVSPEFFPIYEKDVLEFDEVSERFEVMQNWLAKTYVNALNAIHFSHDKYSYERIEMALHDVEILRTMACGIAGLSVAADSLSAIKFAKVTPIRNSEGLIVDFKTEGDYPRYGNNDDKVDEIAVGLVHNFMEKIRSRKTYRNSLPTQSVLTITSNVVYGKKTGNTPDGRRAGEPFAPGANPMHGRDKKGAVASMMSIAKLPYNDSLDGISYTFSMIPGALGKSVDERSEKLASLLDGYFSANPLRGAHHINVNIFDRATLLDAMEHPEKYPQLTVRVSGYAVNFVKLTKEQQMDVVNRTFHERA